MMGGWNYALKCVMVILFSVVWLLERFNWQRVLLISYQAQFFIYSTLSLGTFRTVLSIPNLSLYVQYFDL